MQWWGYVILALGSVGWFIILYWIHKDDDDLIDKGKR